MEKSPDLAHILKNQENFEQYLSVEVEKSEQCSNFWKNFLRILFSFVRLKFLKVKTFGRRLLSRFRT